MCCHHAQQILLVLSIHAICFSHTDNTQAFKYMMLELMIKFQKKNTWIFLVQINSESTLKSGRSTGRNMVQHRTKRQQWYDDKSDE